MSCNSECLSTHGQHVPRGSGHSATCVDGPRCLDCSELLAGQLGPCCDECERAHYNDTDGGRSRARGTVVRL